jgi:hypothetical protein
MSACAKYLEQAQAPKQFAVVVPACTSKMLCLMVCASAVSAAMVRCSLIWSYHACLACLPDPPHRYDGAEPTASSIAASNLYRLAALLPQASSSSSSSAASQGAAAASTQQHLDYAQRASQTLGAFQVCGGGAAIVVKVVRGLGVVVEAVVIVVVAAAFTSFSNPLLTTPACHAYKLAVAGGFCAVTWWTSIHASL